ncbi:ATP-binding protein [Pontibacterium granulatum]|uniref:ATP-binding protein n=1 Tax=Pontibacterium granulatum TaxID=2036029 RepID=UPI00249BC3EE|nr:ATP-binding protein [Pontibacterium granulatum]MDI3326053.1 ATP-binding protein [Pontibacterium granulatum]
MSIYNRIIAACIGLALVAILPFGIMSYLSGKQILQTSVQERLNAVANNQRDKISHVITAWQDRVALIASRTQLRVSLKDYLLTGNPSALAKVNKILSDAQHSVRAVDSIAVGPINGPAIATAGNTLTQMELTPAIPRHKPKIRLVSFATDTQDTLYVRLETAMELEGEIIGRVVVTLHADELLKATRDYTGLGQTGETILTAYDTKYQPVYLSPLRHKPSTPLQQIPSYTINKANLLLAGLSGKEGLMEQVADYRGVVVMAATRYIPEMQWGLVVKMDQQEILSPIANFQKQLILVAIALLFTAVVLGIVLARAIVMPIRALASNTQKIQQGELNLRTRIPSSQTPELQELAISFNRLTENLIETKSTQELHVEEQTRKLQNLNQKLEQRLNSSARNLQQNQFELTALREALSETRNELIHSDKMAALGSLMASLSQEIIKPLGSAITAVSNLQTTTVEKKASTDTRQLDGEELSCHLDLIINTCNQLQTQLNFVSAMTSDTRQITLDLLNPDIRTIELAPYLKKLAASMQPILKSTSYHISITCPHSLQISTYPGALVQALTTLIVGALHRTRETPPQQLAEISIYAEEGAGVCCLQVNVSGLEIAPNQLASMFEPFDTTLRNTEEPVSRLFIVRKIITDTLKGTINCTSTPGQGCCFTINLATLENKHPVVQHAQELLNE